MLAEDPVVSAIAELELKSGALLVQRRDLTRGALLSAGVSQRDL